MKTTSNVANIPIWRNTALENLPNEIWKDIPEYEGYYQASSLGRIKSLKRHFLRTDGVRCSVKEKILKQILNKYGYLAINAAKNGKVNRKLSHRIILSQ